MTHTTHLYVPDATNTLNKVRRALLADGVDGWSEVKLTGYWMAMEEPVTRVEIIGAPRPLADYRDMLRRLMPGEDSVLVTRQPIDMELG